MLYLAVEELDDSPRVDLKEVGNDDISTQKVASAFRRAFIAPLLISKENWEPQMKKPDNERRLECFAIKPTRGALLL